MKIKSILVYILAYTVTLLVANPSISSPLSQHAHQASQVTKPVNDIEKFFVRSMILNESDDLPVVEPPLVQVKLPENATMNQIVTTITLSSQPFLQQYQLNNSFNAKASHKTSKSVEFTLLNNQEEFAIDRHSGSIKLIRAPPANISYILDVTITKVSSNSRKHLTTKVPVLIDISVVKQPELEPLRSSFYSCRVFDSLVKNIPICTVSFKGERKGIKINKKFTMMPQDERRVDGFFRIDERTGSIYKQGSPNAGDYNFLVAETYQGDTLGSVRVKIEVFNSSNIMNRNDNDPPILEKVSSSNIKLREEDEMGKKLVDFSIRDPNSDPIILMIERGDPEGLFDIDGKSLYLVKNLDYSEEKTHNLTIMYTDGVSENHTNIYVHSPRVIQQIQNSVFLHNVTIDEGPISSPSIVIDISNNAFELQYAKFSLYSANSIEALEAFTIDECCGRVKQIKALNYEWNHLHEIIFQIEDVRLSPDTYRSFARLAVYVLDINDNPPRFALDSHQIEILENIATSQPFYRVNATDIDAGENANITYAITEGNVRDIFQIHPLKGLISLNKSLDSFLEGPEMNIEREAETSSDYYQLIITATDHGSSYQLNSSFSLGVRVTVPIEIQPKFTNKSNEIQIREDEKVGSTIYTFHAKSKYPFRYDITNGNDENYFSIGKHDGKLMIQKRLNYNIKIHHDLIITVNLSRASQRVVKSGLSSDSTKLKIILTPKPVIVPDLPKISHEVNTSTTRLPAIQIDSPKYPYIDSNQNQIYADQVPFIPGQTTPFNPNPKSAGENNRPFTENYISLKTLTTIVIGFFAILFAVACFCLMCRCCCRSNKNKRFRDKNGNLLNRSYNSHQRLNSQHSQIGNFNNSMNRSMNSRLSLRATGNVHTPVSVKPNHSKYNAGDSVSLTAINERKSKSLLVPPSPMASRDKISITDQEDENYYANAFGPGHPQYLNQLRRLKPDGTRLSTRLASRKPSSSINMNNTDSRSSDLSNVQSRSSSQLPRTPLRSSSRVPGSSRNRSSNNLPLPARPRKDLNRSRTTNTSTNVSPSLNDNNSRTVLLSDHSVSSKNILSKKNYPTAPKNDNLADYDEVASRSTILDTSPQSSTSESETDSELPLESRFLTFVRKKTKNMTNKGRDNSERLIATSEDTDNGPSTGLLRDYNENRVNGNNNQANGNHEQISQNGRLNIKKSISQNNTDGEEDADDEEEEGADGDDDDNENGDSDEEDEDDEQEGDEVGIYDLNGGSVVTGSIQRNSCKKSSLLDSSQSDNNQSSNSNCQNSSQMIMSQKRTLSDNFSNNNNNASENSRSRSNDLDSFSHRKEPDDL